MRRLAGESAARDYSAWGIKVQWKSWVGAKEEKTPHEESKTLLEKELWKQNNILLCREGAFL